MRWLINKHPCNAICSTCSSEHAADRGEDVRPTNSSIRSWPEAIATTDTPSFTVGFFLLRRYNTPMYGLADAMINQLTSCSTVKCIGLLLVQIGCNC